ncbi:hypothetical protein EUGRSUZ_F01109 [Eucalyptus grandis]|uniref:Uncharacterized protein n=2 Tax=Eucalyptus grandis TaxID=71139 RepID=A0ACC3KDC0_EUCGR|nr:hypothetical protein EUGRSUZ_F01109 [Eucalyptus grandis]
MQINRDVAIEGCVRANELPRACPCINSSRGDISRAGSRSVKTRIDGLGKLEVGGCGGGSEGVDEYDRDVGGQDHL